MKGILNLNKPKGMSSSAAVSKVKKILGIKSAGHMGTLDPAGEGVLLIGIGKATRLFNYFLKKEKIYEADFTFGYETDTLDGEGYIIKNSNYLPTFEELENNLKRLEGKQMQIPPAFSAKSVNGVRAYKLARNGKEVDLKPSEVNIYSAKILSFSDRICKVKIHCSSGTYIRSVCRDLAMLCGSAATMTAIKRLSVGPYMLTDSYSFEQLEQLKEEALQPIEEALAYMQSINLDPIWKKSLDNGEKIDFFKINLKKPTDYFTVYCDGTLYGIASPDYPFIKIITYLKD